MVRKCGEKVLAVGGRERVLPFVLIRKKGMRHIHMSIGHRGELYLSMPWFCRESEVWNFVRQREDWLEGRLREFRERERLETFLRGQGWVSARGEKIPLRCATGRGANAIKSGGGEWVLHLSEALEEPMRERILRELLHGLARRILPPRVGQLAREKELSHGRITVRDQSSRWGSCSSSRNLSFNWRLILLDPAAQDYIIFHELAHLVEMNHSPAFWKLLRELYPETVTQDRWIKEKGSTIMALGRA